MGFDTLTAIGNFRLDRDFNPAVKDPVKIERVIWIGEWPHGSGKWFINVETQFGWMNFSDVTVTFAKTGVANSFNGSVFKTGIYRVSVNSTFDGTTLVTEGSPDAPVSSLNLGNWNESGAPRPTIAQALSGPIVDLLDDDYDTVTGNASMHTTFVTVTRKVA